MLENYGITGVLMLTCIKSFLTNRSQYVRVNSCRSETLTRFSGVAQEPLLFLLFINDVSSILVN